MNFFNYFKNKNMNKTIFRKLFVVTAKELKSFIIRYKINEKY